MTNSHKGRAGIDRLIHATGYSLAGLGSAYRGESAFRLETWAATVLTPLAFWLGRTWLEIALLVASVLLVLIVELLNASIEATIDRVSFDWHELAKRGKDMASAAVMLSVLMCAGIWLAALWQRIGAA